MNISIDFLKSMEKIDPYFCSKFEIVDNNTHNFLSVAEFNLY